AVVGADGKAGLLSCVAARERVGRSGRVVGIGPDRSTAGARLLLSEGYVDAFVEADARDALGLREAARDALPAGAHVTINCVNVAGSEAGTILVTRDGGTICFFSMCTSFTAAALGAEGFGRDLTMLIGNGFVRGHAEYALGLLRNHAALRRYFVIRFSPGQRSGTPMQLGAAKSGSAESL
ncbi:MAG: hypothetical protein ACREM2_06375, partial [Vulcanimicrobiaceae bacterium]